MNKQDIAVLTVLSEFNKVPAGNAKKAWIHSCGSKFFIPETLNTFLRVCTHLIDDMRVTGISNAKWDKLAFNGVNENTTIDSLDSLLDYMEKNSTGRDIDLKEIGGFAVQAEDEQFELIRQIVTRDCKFGVGASVWNEVCPEGWKVDEFECMLANNYKKRREKVMKPGRSFTLTHKLDSERCIIFKRGKQVDMYSRNGKRHSGFVEIEQAVRELEVDNIVLDGELIVKNWRELSSKEQLAQSATIIRKKSERKVGVVLAVFDMIKISDWMSKTCHTPYKDRRINIEVNIKGKSEFLDPLDALYVGTNENKIADIMADMTARDQEGIMINMNDAPYEWKRGDAILKVKEFLDDTYVITGVYEGERFTECEGMLGGVTVEHKGNTVHVGSGFKKTFRQSTWAADKGLSLVGKKIDVKYFEESTDSKTGKPSLRFPTMLKFRPDLD